MLGKTFRQSPHRSCRIWVWRMNSIFIFSGAQDKDLYGTSEHCISQEVLWVRTGFPRQFVLYWIHSKNILVHPRVRHLPTLQLFFFLKHVFGWVLAHLWVSYGCCSKLQQSWLWNNRDLFSSQFCRPEVQNQYSWTKITVRRAVFPVEVLGEIRSLPPPASHGCWRSLTCGCIPPVSASRSHCLLVFCLCQISLCISWPRTFVTPFRVCLGNPGYSPISESFI